ncbi:MAG TPA: hypothetical protein VLY23_15865 [Candidatus Acidoferrum sp.]|nr:hypothetical protein [Candidatus Acidoferrum sp.]
MHDDQNPTIRLMFLASQKFEAGKVVRGAFLLTDSDTKPLEFRTTSPIRPSALQSMLYGSTLQQHIMVELIGIPLLNSLKDRPHLILVRDPEFLPLRPKIEIPTIQLMKEEAIPVSGSSEQSADQLLSSPSGRFEPLVIGTHSAFVSDRQAARALLLGIIGTHDVLEPFTRISNAVEQVHAQKIGEEK